MIGSVGNSMQMFSNLFSRLDTKNQGYLEKSDFASALSQISGEDSSSVDTLFSTLDGDSNGQVTESEFSSVLAQLQQSLDSQFGQMRLAGMGGQGPQGMNGMPPPPPNDEGFTQDELSSQLSELSDRSSPQATMISDIIYNFSAADSDGDGKVSFQEAMSFRQAQETASTSEKAATDQATTDSATTAAQGPSSEMQVMRQIMQLMHAYGSSDASSSASASALLSTLA